MRMLPIVLLLMRSISLLFFIAAAAFAQQPSSTTPDCQFSTGKLTAAGRSMAYASQSTPPGTPCRVWAITYQAYNLSAASVELDGTDDNNGVPGTSWTQMSSSCPSSNPCTVVTGTNPMTDPNQSQLVVIGYFPYVSVYVGTFTTSGAGAYIEIKGSGYRGTSSAPSSGGGGGGGGTQNVNIIEVDGVTVANDSNGGMVPGGASTALTDGISNTQILPDANNAGTPTAASFRNLAFNFNGTSWDRGFICPNSVQVALSGTGYTQIVAGSAGKIIRVCKVFVTSASSGTPVVNTFNVAVGTCSGSPTALLTASGVTGIDEDFSGALRTASGGALCVSESTANSDLVTATYAQY